MDDAIDVVIVAHDSGAELGEAVARALAAEGVARVIVVDNGSRDGAVDRLERQRAGDARLRIHRNAGNPGFGTACNQGARLGDARWIVFLNPDCYVERDTFTRLIDAATAARLRGDVGEIGVLGADVRDRHGAPEAAARRRTPTPGVAIARVLGLGRDARVRDEAGVKPGTLTIVDATSGALMLVPRSVFERLQGFDEGYRLHCEDLDLCRRARALGLVVAVVEGVRVMHLKGTSSAARPYFVAWHKHRGMWRYYRKFDGARHPWPVRAGIAAGIAARAAAQFAAIALGLGRGR